MKKRAKISWPNSRRTRLPVSFSVFVRDALWFLIETGNETYTSIARAADLSVEQVWRFVNNESNLTLSNFDKLVSVAVVQFKLFEITSR